jgi:starch phosphorylase
MFEKEQLYQLLPERIGRLADLAMDLWWSSSGEARHIFRMISYQLWHDSEHNPISILRKASRDRLESLAANPAYLAAYDRVISTYDTELGRSDTPVARSHSKMAEKTVAYFSAEYGLHDSLPIYSGGLGILAGDHVKTAGDIGLPLIAVGFLYPFGYFEQHIESDGTQVADYKHLVMQDTPLEQVILADGKPFIISIHLDGDGEDLHLQVWRVRVGRTTIYLMDSDLELNKQEDREITKRLYGGDKVYRLRQEIALGVGGVRTLHALGIEPDVWHANEGHAAFLFIERLRHEMKQGHSFAQAREKIVNTSVFTTHTPVPAGHDTFSFEVVGEYFHRTIDELGITKEDFIALGDRAGEFNMTALAMNMTARQNAVSKKHEEVTRKMWPGYNEIGSVTNGIHIVTWLAQEWRELFSSVLSPQWKQRLTDSIFWQEVHAIPDEMFWNIRQELAETLQRQIISELSKVYTYNDETNFLVRGALYEPTALTIGFARRFATYKRASLLFRDPERLASILNREGKPVQIIFSGKAHPADKEGQALIRTIWNYAADPLFRGKVFFIENYSMHTAKLLVSGVDLWLNTPRVPMEASGTSGMKAAINGVPNLSIADGWWCEGFNGYNGWSVNSPENITPDEQDEHDANAIYGLLEREIVPLFYERDLADIPRGWVQVAKESMASIIPRFTSERMLFEYIEKYYRPGLG